MDVGQAFIEKGYQDGGDRPETPEEIREELEWFEEFRKKYRFLSWPLTNFLRIPQDDQRIYLNEFVPDWDLDDNGPNPDYVEECMKFLQDLGSNKASTTPTVKQTGDKWMSPGRMVCSWPDLDPTARLVMFVMAAHGDNKGENIWISQSKIADYLGLSKRTVQRAMSRLEDEKAISMTAEPRQHKPPTWCLNHGPGVT